MKNKLLILGLVVVVFLSCNDTPKETKLNVMTFNIRLDHAGDSLNNWQYRKDIAGSMVRFYDVDILGTQEVLHNQLVDLRDRLADYESVGVGREDGAEKGEYSAVFYKRSRFDLLNSGTFWLSENPNAVGKKGWDAACERVVSWAHLKDKSTKKEFVFFNTHFDHMGVEARRNSSLLILSKVKEIAKGLPAVITGDFNANPETDVYKELVNPNNPDRFTDARNITAFKHGEKSSFHNFGRIPVEKRELIDFIFVKNINKVSRYGIINESVDGVFLTDHNPVFATIEF